MKQKFIFMLVWFPFFSSPIFSQNQTQNLSQTLRGSVVDADSRQPLIGAQISLTPSPSPKGDGSSRRGTASDEKGNFRLENVPIGRVEIQVSYLGFENLVVPNLVVNSGKEVVLSLEMRESTQKISEIQISASQNRGEALNEMAMLSARSISPEETNRYAGGFNDPSRILSNFAGVTSTQDGSNDIIVRGNSPKYVQWRLEGEQITNPNHFGDQSAVGGSVSILNNNLLAASDFHTGAFAPEFGDALSGVYDLRLRPGNNEKTECIFGFGLLGTEMTVEGPFKKGYGGSFLVNYRYSTAGLLSKLGLLGDFNGVLNFQDATFKMVFPTRRAGVFSIFGLGGTSNFKFEDVTPALWVVPGNNTTRRETRNDFDKRAHLFNFGVKNVVSLNSKSFLNTTLTYSNEGIADDIFEAGVIRFFDDAGEQIRDSVLNRKLNFQSDLRKPTYRASTTYNLKLNARHKLQIGSKFTLFDYQFEQNRFAGEANLPVPLVNFSENVATLRNFVSWKFRASERVQFVAGLHNFVTPTSRSGNAAPPRPGGRGYNATLEPRLAAEIRATDACKINVGYGRHSTMESIHHYFAKVERPDGTFFEPNRDLDLLKADHFVVGFERRLAQDFRMKLDFYYQNLFDLPVENLDTSHFATIVEGLDFRHVELVNAGKGRNFGAELTFEKFFSRSWYLLLNTSIFESKYTALDGVERNTPFNSNYLFNFLCGKEFPNLGKKRNRTLGLNAKVFVAGGRKIIPLRRDAAGNLAVDLEKNQVWDYEKAFTTSLDDPYQIQISASYKWQKRRATHELFLNLDNLTNHKGRIMEFYDETEPGKIGYQTQFGFFPNLMYRVYF